MININRCTDDHNDTLWVAHKQDGARCYQLYVGKDVNEAIAAAVKAGMTRADAVDAATKALGRNKVLDTILDKAKPNFEPCKNGLLVHSEG